MPPRGQRAENNGGIPNLPQGPKSQFAIFENFSQGMNVQAARQGLDKRAAAWMENFQPVAANRLAVVPGPEPAMATLSITVARSFDVYFNNQNYYVAFGTDGSLWVVPVSGAVFQIATAGTPVQVAPSGTFSPTGGDVATWLSKRLLITDSQSGYCTWDGTVFVEQGGVSPNIVVTAGGSGYVNGATVAISGGSGSGATAFATVVGGVVTAIALSNAGVNYQAGDTLTVTITAVSGGSGATANAHVWPFVTPKPTTLTVGFSRVSLGIARTFILTGVGSSTWGDAYDDFQTADDSVTTVIGDTDLITQITAIRFLEGYIYIIGDNSVKFIGSISGTTFTITPLSSDQGTTFLSSVVSYNRLVVFANVTGVFAVFGASVEKISGPMDGIFANADFTLPIQCAVNDLNNIHILLVLVRYTGATVRTLLLAYFDKKWFVINQGNSIVAMTTMILGGHSDTVISSGSDITQILQSTSEPVDVLMQTALSHENNPIYVKDVLALGVAQTLTGQSGEDLSFTVDTETASTDFTPTNEFVTLQLLNNSGGMLALTNNSGGALNLYGSGFALSHSSQSSNGGRFIGASVKGTAVTGGSFQAFYLEYHIGPQWGKG